MSGKLEPTTPAEAVEWYLTKRETDVSEKTLQNHRYRLEQFVAFCTEFEIDNLNDLSGRDLHHYKVHRREEDGLKNITLQGQLSTLRQYLDFCESIDAVPTGLHDRVLLPSTTTDEEVSDEMLPEDQAWDILHHLKTYEYASRRHAIFALAWHAGLRLGGLRALDLEDFDTENQSLRLRHRPETDTPLKNGEDGERIVALSEGMTNLLEDYVSVKRVYHIDEHGREPLFTSNQGRLSKNGTRDTFYRLTVPCLTGECPHDRNPRECEALTEHSSASKCPSSLSPHPVRRGAITHHRRKDLPVKVVGERVNASPEVIEKHYDRRTERERMEQRREYLDDLED